jgi:hypothetical protein
MANPNPSPSTRFGAEKAPEGRAKQKGVRDRMSAAFLTALADDFDQHGVVVVAQVREKDPSTYVRVFAGLMPKELAVTNNPLDGLSDDELEKAIACFRAWAHKLDGAET